MADLPDVLVGDQHTKAHNDERHILNQLLPANITDGQIMSYSAALGRMTPITPPGGTELAAAVNASNNAIALNVQAYGGQTFTPLTGSSITVPPSNGLPVTVEWDGLIAQGTAGAGNLWVGLFAQGNSNAVALSIHPLPLNAGDTVDSASNYMMFHGIARLGVISSSTTYSLGAMIYKAGSGSPAASLYPLPTVPLVVRAMTR